MTAYPTPDAETVLNIIRAAGFDLERVYTGSGVLQAQYLITPLGYSYMVPLHLERWPHETVWDHFQQLNHHEAKF